MSHIRPATPEDAAAIAGIYAHYVRNSVVTFEEVPPEAAEIAARMEKIWGAGLPYLVAEEDGAVTGYAYAGPFHTRSAYRFTVENSVYVAAARAGQGTGTALMQALIEACRAKGLKQMVARITADTPSVAFHGKLGFTPAGRLQAVGLKQGRWLDVVEMQLAL